MTKLWLPVAILLLGQNSPVLAMGLGNIEVHSSLGQPLNAYVDIIDAPPRLETGCFRLFHGHGDLPFTMLNANFMLHSVSAERTRLGITTHQIFNEPIIFLQLVSDCDNEIRREYTLLLDPPLSNEVVAATPKNSTIQSGNQPMAQPSAARDVMIPAESTARVSDARPSSAKPSSSARHQKSESIKAAARTGNTQTHNTTPDPAQNEHRPTDTGWLVISGDGYLRPDFFDTPLQLQMSTELKDWPADKSIELTSEDVSDEITAMSNRLAYLENQIMALQKRNSELEVNQASMSSNNRMPSWASYLMLTLGIMGLLVLMEWLRRRNVKRRIEAEMAIWDELAPQVDQKPLADEFQFPEVDTSIVAKKENTTEHLDFLDATPPLHVQHHTNAGTTINEDILEQAEVFVAHGRPSLAITLLQDHLAEVPDFSPEPWLMLLDLLKRDNQRDAYNAASSECRRYFNVAIPEFDTPLLDDQSSIDNFPHIMQQLQQVWGSPEAIAYLDDLIYNRRDEARQGFGRNAYLEILLLRSIAKSLADADPLTMRPRSTPLPVPALQVEVPEIEVSSTEQTLALEPIFEESTQDEEKVPELLFGDLSLDSLPEDKSVPLEFDLTSIEKETS